MTDSNRTELTYIKETTWGTTPGSPSMTELRMTSETLSKNISNVTSAEIRSDRQVTDLVQASKSAGGDVNFELSYGTYDDFLQSALFSADFTSDIGVSATDISATGSGFNASSTDVSAIAVGQIIKVSGFSDSSIDGYYRVTANSSGSLTTTPAPPATESAGQTIAIKGQYIRNGTTQNSFTLEKNFDAVTEFFKFTGMVVDVFNLNLEAENIVTGNFGFIGKDGSMSASSLDASPTPANTNDVLNAIGNVASIQENDTEVGSPNYVRSLSLSLANNLRAQTAVGNDALIGVGSGKCDITGVMNTYFGNSNLFDKFLGGTETSLMFRISDGSGNVYVFDLPRIKFDSGDVSAGGQDQDVFAELNYRALRDQTYGYTIQISKFDA